MTNLILSIDQLDYAIIHTGYDDRFLSQEEDDSGKTIRPIDELIAELKENGEDDTYIGIYNINGAIHGYRPVQVTQMINVLPNSGVIFKMSDVGHIFNMGIKLSELTDKYELMYGYDISSMYRIKYIENNGTKIIVLYFDTESG